jgi:hypothetical protein
VKESVREWQYLNDLVSAIRSFKSARLPVGPSHFTCTASGSQGKWGKRYKSACMYVRERERGETEGGGERREIEKVGEEREESQRKGY